MKGYLTGFIVAMAISLVFIDRNVTPKEISDAYTACEKRGAGLEYAEIGFWLITAHCTDGAKWWFRSGNFGGLNND